MMKQNVVGLPNYFSYFGSYFLVRREKKKTMKKANKAQEHFLPIINIQLRTLTVFQWNKVKRGAHNAAARAVQFKKSVFALPGKNYPLSPKK